MDGPLCQLYCFAISFPWKGICHCHPSIRFLWLWWWNQFACSFHYQHCERGDSKRSHCVQESCKRPLVTHLSNSTFGTRSQKLPTPPTSSRASPAYIASLRAQLAPKEREIQQLRQSETVQIVGLVGYANDSANWIMLNNLLLKPKLLANFFFHVNYFHFHPW